MKKILAKILSAITVLTILSLFTVTADTQKTMDISLRIEGISQCHYYKEISVPYDEKLTVADVLKFADNQSDSLTISGINDGYISSVNDDTSGKLGGWSGWMYTVNDVSPTVGISDFILNDKDVILLYYSDQFNEGFQFPIVDTSEINNGIISFTSNDIIYDEDFNPSVVNNPIVGATVEFDGAKFITDENGKVNITSDLLSNGDHSLQISKYKENGLPLILRLAPDYKISIEKAVVTPDDNQISKETKTDTSVENPKVGEHDFLYLSVSILFTSAAVMFVFKNHANA